MKALFYLVMISFLFVGSCSPKGKTPPKAVKGVLDLRDWDFDPSTGSGTDGTINLDGEWEFYWKEFPVGENLELPEEKRDFIQVPNAWNGHVVKRSTESGEVLEETLGGEGYATYRLKVLLKEEMDLGMRLPNQSSAYELFINKKNTYKFGIAEINKEKTIPNRSINYIKIHSYNNEFIVILKISNFLFNNGGFTNQIKLGNENFIYKLKDGYLSTDLFIAGILFIIGVYHLALYFLRTEDRSPLYFGIFTLLIFLRTMILGERYIHTLVPNFSYSLSFSLEYLSIYIGTPIFLEFFYSLYREDINNNIRKITISICLISSLLVIFLSPNIYSRFLVIVQIVILINIIYGIYILIKAINYEREGAVIFLLGFFIFAITMLNDILYFRKVTNTGNFAPAGLVIFIFAQSYLLSARFSKAFTDAKEARLLAEEQKQLVQAAKEEIERLGRTKDEFLANLSHEIKTPLVTIYGYSEMITLEEDLPESTKEYGREIYKSASHLNSYMDDVLLVTDLETNLQLDQKPILFSDLLQESLHNLDPFLQEKNIRPEISDLTGITLTCDSLLWGRALTNVLKNGIVYNQAGGVLRIHAEKKGQGVQISVIDSGIGILPEFHEKIFEKFFRIDSSLSYEVSGVGLGLFLAKRILELHGGSIGVRSELGKGSLFVIDNLS
jgi:signal transduction histidine kinase